jgi:16S rRNA (adenine1518-N6/adenine1519-N6)-dimethyltransferase
MPKKKWGQNFLRNRGAVEKIVAAVQPQPDEVIVEIGPGEGVLTEPLLLYPNRVIAIEIDPELAHRLTARFGDRLELRNEDALTTDFPSQPYRAVGNLPYNVGTPILRRAIADPLCRRAVFMLQKEVADRLTARPGDEAYGYLTLFTRLYAEPRTLMTLEPKSFYPPPKVRSAVVVLDPKPRDYSAPPEQLEALISSSFRMRRKKLVNNVTGFRELSRETAKAAIEAAALSEDVRAETMSLHDFDRLWHALEIAQPTARLPDHTNHG